MNLKEFTEPPHQYRPIPRWSLNQELEPAELETQLRDFSRKGYGGVIVHAGAGLKTQYLSDTWMRTIRRIVEAAKDLKLEIWLADEDRGPSGHGGGQLTDGHDEFVPHLLVLLDATDAADAGILDTALAFLVTGENGAIRQVTEPPADLSGVQAFCPVPVERGDALANGETFADVMNPAAVQAFIELTQNRYADTLKYDHGEHLPGIISLNTGPQPTLHRLPVSGSMVLPWTAGLPVQFERMHGYSLIDRLYYLTQRTPEGFRIRHNYWHTVSDLFIDTFTLALSSQAGANGLMYAGTIGSPGGLSGMFRSGGASMPHFEHMAVPIVESPGTSPHHHTAVKEAVSAGIQFGKPRVMAQVFAGTGYDATFTDLKAIVDIHTALGISVLSPEKSLYSTIGDRKYGTPPTFSYPNPAWDQMRALNDYLTRASWIAAQGNEAARVLVMSPVSGAYGACDLTAADGGDELAAIDRSYRAVVDELTAEHISFHIGDERITGRYGEVHGDTLRIGYGDYTTVVLPPASSWRSPVVELLESFTGQIIIMGELPGMVDGASSDRFEALANRETVAVVSNTATEVTASIITTQGRRLSVALPDGSEARQVMALHRIDAGAHLLFLANTADTSTDIAVALDALGGVVELDLPTGRGFRYSARNHEGSTRIETTLPAFGSRAFIVDQTQTSVEHVPAATTETPLTMSGPFGYALKGENCLVLDTCSLNMDKKSLLKHAPLWKVKRTIQEKTGLDEYIGVQPWVLAQRNIRSRTNTTELTFTFTVNDIPEKIALAMEQSDRFTIMLNGEKIDYTPGRWFIDRRYRVLHLEDRVVQGENVLTATTDYLWDTEISPLYVFGTFALGPASEGFPIITKPSQLTEGSWTDQGFPFYAGAVTYTFSFAIDTGEGISYELDLSGAEGTLHAVRVNETDIGLIPFPPYRGDITGALVDGSNLVEVTVYGSLRNLFGPLHNTAEDTLPMVTAETFIDDAVRTDKYLFKPYGLLSAPRLIKITHDAPPQEQQPTGSVTGTVE